MPVTTTKEAPLRFHPLLPETQEAMRASMDFDRYDKHPFSADDRATSNKLRSRYQALAAKDPGAILNEAEELERAVERDPVQFASLAQVAVELRAKAETLSAPALAKAA